jgi:hypothetical protein
MRDIEAYNHGKSPRVRFAETTSSIGAGILGIGLGVLFAKYLNAFGVAFLLLGTLMHAWGMFDMRRMEIGSGHNRPLWSTLLYWICWLALGVLTLGLVIVNLS